MPIYDFRCDAGHEFDMLVPMGMASATCPACRKPAEKVFSIKMANRASGHFRTTAGDFISASDWRKDMDARLPVGGIKTNEPDRLQEFLENPRAMRDADARATFTTRNGFDPVTGNKWPERLLRRR